MGRKTSHSPAKSLKEPTALPDPSQEDKTSKTFRIANELGLHARAAAQFVKIASRFGSDVYVTKDSNEVNGKSIMGILMLAAAKGSKITIRTEGTDAKEALEALGELIDNKFGEK